MQNTENESRIIGYFIIFISFHNDYSKTGDFIWESTSLRMFSKHESPTERDSMRFLGKIRMVKNTKII